MDSATHRDPGLDPSTTPTDQPLRYVSLQDLEEDVDLKVSMGPLASTQEEVLDEYLEWLDGWIQAGDTSPGPAFVAEISSWSHSLFERGFEQGQILERFYEWKFWKLDLEPVSSRIYQLAELAMQEVFTSVNYGDGPAAAADDDGHWLYQGRLGTAGLESWEGSAGGLALTSAKVSSPSTQPVKARHKSTRSHPSCFSPSASASSNTTKTTGKKPRKRKKMQPKQKQEEKQPARRGRSFQGPENPHPTGLFSFESPTADIDSLDEAPSKIDSPVMDCKYPVKDSSGEVNPFYLLSSFIFYFFGRLFSISPWYFSCYFYF